MTMHLMTEKIGEAWITIDAPYGEEGTLKLQRSFDVVEVCLTVEDMTMIIEELTAARDKCEGYRCARDKDAYIESLVD